MNISWDRLARWLTLLALGFALGIGFLTLRQRTQPAPVDIIPPQPTASPQPTATAARVRVYVTGAVRTPAVYELDPGSIVDDAVRAAGGFSDEADPTAINLAQPLSDGMQITVPTALESEPQSIVVTPSGAGSAVGGPSRLSGDIFAGLVNINTATAIELEALPGIGPSIAGAIVAYREANGPFATVDALLDVPGIGDAKLAAIRELVAVGP